MKKLILSVTAVMILCLTVTSCALADGKWWNGNYYDGSDYNSDWYDMYIVSSTSPNGYCYLYSEPSDSDSSRNLGRHNNGEKVRVLVYNAKNGYSLCACSNGKVGFIRSSSLREDSEPEYLYVYSTNPYGYAYLYSKPTDSDWESRNLGQYVNGSEMQIIEWNGYSEYIYVRSTETNDYGYMKASVLYTLEDYHWEVDYTATIWHQRGYVYLYSKPSSDDYVSRNLGKLVNGETVYVLNWNAGNGYSYVKTMSGKDGYVQTNCLN
ncbi:MAG: hypothetical protein CW338_00455 [Clostridiales bacterium]|nr:hypothetical protein [Clostridiales bacterium]